MKNINQKKVWFDFDNSPHVPFFLPIVKSLINQGVQVTITVRDCFQVVELAELAGLQYKIIGKHYGKHKLFKVIGLIIRAFQMIPFLIKERPDLAVSHGSRSQMFISAFLGLPWIVLVDYEHVKLLPFVKAGKILVPEVVPVTKMQKKANAVVTYPGIKEDVYVPGFQPNDTIREQLSVLQDEILVTLRPPANQAHYHNPASEKLFKNVMDFLVSKDNVKILLLPRDKEQGIQIKNEWPEFFGNKLFIPKQVFAGLDIIWASDLVISGGGTMNREAAALGVPVFSIFQGKLGAVDKFLAESNRLVLITPDQDLETVISLSKREKTFLDNSSEQAKNCITNEIIKELGLQV